MSDSEPNWFLVLFGPKGRQSLFGLTKEKFLFKWQNKMVLTHYFMVTFVLEIERFRYAEEAAHSFPPGLGGI